MPCLIIKAAHKIGGPASTGWYDARRRCREATHHDQP